MTISQGLLITALHNSHCKEIFHTIFFRAVAFLSSVDIIMFPKSYFQLTLFEAQNSQYRENNIP